MTIYPKLSLTFLNGFLLILPMLGLRYGIPILIRKDALAELDYFPPVRGLERFGLKIYLISNTFLVFSPLLAKIISGTSAARTGWAIYLGGLLVLVISLIQYCREEGLKQNGIYRFSRNPLCVGYFLIFIAASLLIGSWFHLVLALIYQTAVHYLVLSEERWCLENFGEDFQIYQQRTPRYFLFKGKL